MPDDLFKKSGEIKGLLKYILSNWPTTELRYGTTLSARRIAVVDIIAPKNRLAGVSVIVELVSGTCSFWTKKSFQKMKNKSLVSFSSILFLLLIATESSSSSSLTGGIRNFKFRKKDPNISNPNKKMELRRYHDGKERRASEKPLDFKFTLVNFVISYTLLIKCYWAFKKYVTLFWLILDHLPYVTRWHCSIPSPPPF